MNLTMVRRRTNYIKICFTLSLLYFIYLLSIEATVSPLMDAAVLRSFGKPNSIVIEKVPWPTINGNQVLVEVRAAGINHIDAYQKQGAYPKNFTLPAVMGREISGYVEKLGINVTKFKEADRVFCSVPCGGFAEYAAANEDDCYPLPDVLTFREGAAVYTDYFTAYRAVMIKAHVKKDHLVLIHGAAEGLGPAAIQICKMVGARVFATVKGRISEELMNRSGADYVSYHNSPLHVENMIKVLNISGFDIILENLDDNYDLEWDKHHLAPGGSIIVTGLRGYVTVDVLTMASSEGSLYGVSLFKYTQKEKEEAAKFILSGMFHGYLNPVIGGEYALENNNQALIDMTWSNAATRGKLIFIFHNFSTTDPPPRL